MKKSFSILILGLMTLVGVYLLQIRLRTKNTLITQTPDNNSVATSFYPLYFFAQEIGKGVLTIKNITPPGVEPHEYELTSQNVIDIAQSNVLIVNGLFEPWIKISKKT